MNSKLVRSCSWLETQHLSEHAVELSTLRRVDEDVHPRVHEVARDEQSTNDVDNDRVMDHLSEQDAVEDLGAVKCKVDPKHLQ